MTKPASAVWLLPGGSVLIAFGLATGSVPLLAAGATLVTVKFARFAWAYGRGV